jgi:hypothetical protein
MRVLFTGISGDTRYRFAGRVPYAFGVPRSASTERAELNRNYNLTSNKGNMMIGEAASRIFHVTRPQSAFIDVRFLAEKEPDAAALRGIVRDHFDVVVFAMANAIRPNQNHEAMVRFLEIAEPEFVVLGAGMQSPLEASLDLLTPSTARLLALFNERARLFGVRGRETEGWLHSVGLERAVALGCPSLYLYPRNILGLRPPRLDGDPRLLSAGYMVPRSIRGQALVQLLGDATVDYVFQEEMFSPSSESPVEEGFLNDATGEVDAAYAARAIEGMIGQPSPFRRYWYFQNPDGWRQACAHYDAFVGDRFHGAVAALQSGLPAVILHRDLRVREMCDLFGIPQIALDYKARYEPGAWRDVLGERLSTEALGRFHARYRTQFETFRAATAAAGLKMAHAPHDLPDLQQRAA